MAEILIDQVGLSAGTPGESRTDGLDNALVTLTSVNSATETSWAWRIIAVAPEGESAPTITNATSSVATFTPNPTNGATYLIELVVDSGLGTESVSRRIFAIRKAETGLRHIAFAELSDPENTIQSNDAEASTDNEGGSWRGWADDLNAWLDAIEDHEGRIDTLEAAPGTGEVNVGSNVGGGAASLYSGKSGTALQFRTVNVSGPLTANTVGDLITLGSSAEANTASNLGVGEGVFASKSGADLQFKSLVGGAGVTLTSDASTVTITRDALPATDVADLTFSGASAGDLLAWNGSGLARLGVGGAAQVLGVSGGAPAWVDLPASGEVNTASTLGAGAHVYSSKVGADLRFRSLVAGANVTLSTSASEITIASTAPNSLGDLADVANVSSPGAGSLLYHDGNNWTEFALSGSNGEVLAIDNGGLAWTTVSGGGGASSLQGAYDGGSSITLGAGGPVSITAASAGTAALDIVTGRIEMPDGFAIGQGSAVAETESVVIGRLARTVTTGSSTRFSTVIGDNASVTDADSAVVIGRNAAILASAVDSVAIGFSAAVRAGVTSGIAIGTVADVVGNKGIAIGESSNADGLDGISIGRLSFASGTESIALGHGSNAALNHSVAIGGDAAGSGGAAVAVGRLSVASGTEAVAIGQQASASANSTVSIGDASDASLQDSIAVGRAAAASGAQSVAISFDAVASGTGAVAVGTLTDALGSQSVALGSGAQALGASVVAIGDAASAVNSDCVAIGRGAEAGSVTADEDTAVGRFARATGNRSTAIGFASQARTSTSTAIGSQAEATGAGAITINGLATGAGSFALGSASSSTHNRSIALGQAATTTKANQLVIGGTDVGMVEAVIGYGAESSTPQPDLLFTTTSATTGSGASGTNLQLRGGLGNGAGTDGYIELLSAVRANASVGTAGQVLTSRGPGLSPQWSIPTDVPTDAAIEVAGNTPMPNDVRFVRATGLGGFTVTLPTAPTGGQVAIAFIRNDSDGSITIAAPGGTQINSSPSISLPADTGTIVAKIGTNWVELQR